MSLLSCWDYSFIGDEKLKLELLFSYKPKFGYKESGKIKHYDKFLPEFGIFLTKDSGSSFVNIDIIAFRRPSGYGIKNDNAVELILESPDLCLAFGEDLKSNMERLNVEMLNKKRSGGVCGNIMSLGKRNIDCNLSVSSVDSDLENIGKNKERVFSMVVQENEGIKRLFSYAERKNNFNKLEEEKVSEVIDSAKHIFNNIALHKSRSDGICSSLTSGSYNFSNNSISAGSGVIALSGLIGLMSSGHFVVGLVFCAGVLGASRLAARVRKPLFSNSFSDSLGVSLNNNNLDNLDDLDNIV